VLKAIFLNFSRSKGGIHQEMRKKTIFGLSLFFILMPGFALSPSPIARPADNYTWLGPTGDALPFDSFQEVEDFLLKAEVARAKTRREGVNKYKKVVLDNGGVWANGLFRWENEVRHSQASLGVKGRHFRDSYESELAAYKISEILDLNNVPPTVYREVQGRSGSVQIWMEKAMKEMDLARKGERPPDIGSWNRQKRDMYVFDNLINNMDRNQSNIVIDKDWNLWLIDHTRSFAMDGTLPAPDKISQCSRSLWDAIIHLDEGLVRESLAPLLRGAEVDAFFERRKKIIEILENRVSVVGESQVFYD
jgi:hypothetical protein